MFSFLNIKLNRNSSVNAILQGLLINESKIILKYSGFNLNYLLESISNS